MRILVTGAAGFIGFHLVQRLVKDGHSVVGLDNLNDYYDPGLKLARLERCGIESASIAAGKTVRAREGRDLQFVKADLADAELVGRLFSTLRFDGVCHLAAQAGVRYSLSNPFVYVDSNVKGFLSILEACRTVAPRHLVYASSSSVYGLNQKIPFSTADNVDHPISLYAATKKANELMAHTYSHLFGIPTTGLRFFSVYGPWGRPDMALFKFTRAAFDGDTIDVYNNGRMVRDFTYVDDIVEGVVRVLRSPPQADPSWAGRGEEPSTSSAPYRLYNIGNGGQTSLMEFIEAIEACVGRPLKKRFLPMQPGDVPATRADIADLEKDFGYHPCTAVKDGIKAFVDWYRAYYRHERNNLGA